MKLTIRALGLTLLEFHVDDSSETTDHIEYDEPGSCTTYPVGFTATHELPDEVGLPQYEGDDEC
jgi:hypothetical protein